MGGVGRDREESVVAHGGGVAHEAPARDQGEREREQPAGDARRIRPLPKREQQEQEGRRVELAPEPDFAALRARQIAAEYFERRPAAALELRPLQDQPQRGGEQKGREQDQRGGQELPPERIFPRRQDQARRRERAQQKREGDIRRGGEEGFERDHFISCRRR